MKQTVLITGASSGIGAELSKLFAADGYDLVLVARSETKLHQLADDLQKAYPIHVTVLASDLSQPDAPAEIFNTLQSQGISIDILVNNAGYGTHGSFEELDLAAEQAMLELDVMSPVKLTRLFLPGMVARGRGRILNLGSTGSFAPVPLMASYGAAKAFVLSFSEALSEELRGKNVTVTALCPGVTITGFQERSNVMGMTMLRGPVQSAAEVARTGYNALMRGQAVVVPGLFNKLMAFSVRFSPRSLSRWMSHQLMKSEQESKKETAAR